MSKELSFAMICSLLSAIGRPKVEDFPKYAIYRPGVAFGCLNPVTQNLEDIISFPTYLIFSNHSWFPAGGN